MYYVYLSSARKKKKPGPRHRLKSYTRMDGIRRAFTVTIGIAIWSTVLAVTPPVAQSTPSNIVILPFSTQSSVNSSESISPTTASLSNMTFEETINEAWACPYVSEVSGISCTCDVPHTVRCRGQASRPEDLLTLTKTLNSEGVVSLLDLAVHGLGELPGGGFANMELLGLVVTTADLKSITSEAFKGLEESLAALGLPNNKLNYVPVDALKRLKQLQRLDLSDNLIEELKSRAFPTLLQLQNLNLAGNGLHLLHPEAFVRLPRLQSLNLARNQLDAAQLNEKTLRGLHMLERLSLQSNLLKGAITPTLITGARGLKSLDLSDNALTRVTRSSLAACPELRDLDLSHNRIDVIEDHAFSNLKQLQRLKLSHNRVVAVSGWSLAHMPKLVHLGLADNALRAVTGDLLHQLSNLNTLDLAANDISLLQPHVFNSTPALQHLTFTDNPLHCDCSLKWFVHWLNQHPSLTPEERNSAVCATPPALENAPLVELKDSQLVCSEETSPYHDYHDYYHDYYHDDAIAEDMSSVRVSDAEISLQVAHWVYKKNAQNVMDDKSEKDPFFGVELVWRVDDRAIPYTCEGVFVYEVLQGRPESHQVLMEKVEANCTSDGNHDPNHVSVVVPGDALVPGATYRYCLILLERGTGDQEAFLPGCSEPLVLAAAPFTMMKHKIVTSHPPEVLSLTAGEVGGALVVHTRVNGDDPCTYTLAIVAEQTVVATRQLNCSEARHEFTSLATGDYIICADPDVPGFTLDLSNLQNHLIVADNVTRALHRTFSECTPVITLAPVKDKGLGMGPLLTLLFTVPGLALVVTLYFIAQKVWRGGGVPWRWDPRAQKSSKYFLYTGEIANPSLSLDPLPEDTPETTTPV
ncbi:leucine-rich repeat-containing protein 15-like isoform X1 [Macrobrachium rosenbergii]|uniref:leucine-rich repeat-containing protein 15-like isoform X1 n=2 Tax=Macrobrachium rosenbergii TaxID=79674 RepID=UPI0034D4E846